MHQEKIKVLLSKGHSVEYIMHKSSQAIRRWGLAIIVAIMISVLIAFLLIRLQENILVAGEFQWDVYNQLLLFTPESQSVNLMNNLNLMLRFSDEDVEKKLSAKLVAIPDSSNYEVQFTKSDSSIMTGPNMLVDSFSLYSQSTKSLFQYSLEAIGGSYQQ